MKTIDSKVKQEILEKCKNNPELKNGMPLEYNVSISTINNWLREAENIEKDTLTVSEEIKLSDDKIHSLIKNAKNRVIDIQKNPDNHEEDGIYLKEEAATKIHDLYFLLGLRLVYDVEKI